MMSILSRHRVAMLFLCFVGMLAHVQAQEEVMTNRDKVFGDGVDAMLTDAARFHVTLHSQGAGIGFQRGQFDGVMRVAGWQADLVFVRHPKEEKTRNPVYEESLPYVYGKVNAHHALRLQRYSTELIAKKARKSGVMVARTTAWGPILGISKPVFLEIGYPEIPYTSLEIEQYNPVTHFSDRIYGRAPWVNGLESLSVNPGFCWSNGMSFEFHDERESTRSIDLGVQLDGYVWPVEILAEEFVPSSRFHLTFFLRYAWGAEWAGQGLGDVLK